MAADLKIIVSLKDKASKALDGIKRKAGALGSAAGKVMRAGVLAGGVAIAGLGVAALKMGLDFERSMAEVRTLLPDIADDAFGVLKDGILDVSKELGIASGKAVPALYQAISAGVPPDNVLDFMRTAGKAAVGGATDLETAVDGITSVVNAYGAETIDAGKASDVMFTAVRLGKTDFQQLSQSLFNVIPTAASLGVSFEDVSASLAVLTGQGTPTSVATTQIRSALVEASQSGTKLSTAIDDLTGKSFSELIEQGVSMPTIFERLRTSMPEQDFKDLFSSVEATNAILGITGPNFEKTGDAMREMAEATGASDAALGVMSKTASFKLNKAINTIKVELTKVGVKILPLLVKALDKATPFLEENIPRGIAKIKKFIRDARPHVEKFIRIFHSGLKTLREAFEPLVRFILSNKSALIIAIAAIGIAILLAFGPAAIAIVALIGLITLIGLLRENWDKLKIVVLPVGVAFGIVGAIMLATLVPALLAKAAALLANVIMWGLLLAPILVIIAVIALIVVGIMLLIKHWDKVKATTISVVDTMAAKVLWLKDQIVGAFNSAIEWIKDNWPLLLAILTGPFGLAVLAIITNKDEILGVAKDIKDNIIGAFTDAKDGVLGALGGLWTGIAGKMSGIANAVKFGMNNMISLFERGINTIIRAWNDLEFSMADPTGVLGTLGLPSKISIGTPNIPTVSLPRLQKGGEVLRTGMAVVHEGERFSRGGGGGNVVIEHLHLGVGVTHRNVAEFMDIIESEQAARRRRGR